MLPYLEMGGVAWYPMGITANDDREPNIGGKSIRVQEYPDLDAEI